ncbi:50S ribosomal protein L25 [Candidatus Microgenomates bacterium]|nr:MAG: 50S ribosomal protein L25 [Candidatus Microgenomates bacterium]
MTVQKLEINKRDKTGRKVKVLRREGVVPANVFGRGIKSYSVQVDAAAFAKVFEEAGETGIIELVLGKETNPALVSSVQRDPVTGYIIHIDFKQVDLKQKVSATVAIELIGESPAEKQSVGVVVQQMDEIDVEALPMDLPEKFEIDASVLSEVGSAVYVKDLKYDKAKVEIDADPEQIIVKVEELQKEEAPMPVAEAQESATEETSVEVPDEAQTEKSSEE